MTGASSQQRPTVAFIHTVVELVPVFAALAEELTPEAEVFHVVDESLLRITRTVGVLTAETRRRALGYMTSAADAGADLVVVTCSSIGPAVDAGRSFVSVPVLRIDEPMAKRALELGSRIGVLATLATTLRPTAELIERLAREAEKPVQVAARVCEGAFEALMAGDRDRHDAIVGDAFAEAVRDAEVVVLAQASMARALEGLQESPVPVLSSPRLGMLRVAELVSSRAD